MDHTDPHGAATAQPSCSVLPLPPLERVQTAQRDDRLQRERQRRHRHKQQARRARARIVLMQALSTAHSSPSEMHHAQVLVERRETLDLTVGTKQADASMPEEREAWKGRIAHDSPKQQHWQMDGVVKVGTDIAVAPRTVMTPPSSLFVEAAGDVDPGLDTGSVGGGATAEEAPGDGAAVNAW